MSVEVLLAVFPFLEAVSARHRVRSSVRGCLLAEMMEPNSERCVEKSHSLALVALVVPSINATPVTHAPVANVGLCCSHTQFTYSTILMIFGVHYCARAPLHIKPILPVVVAGPIVGHANARRGPTLLIREVVKAPPSPEHRQPSALHVDTPGRRG